MAVGTKPSWIDPEPGSLWAQPAKQWTPARQPYTTYAPGYTPGISPFLDEIEKEKEKPTFGTFETLTAAQKLILAGLQGGRAPTFQPPSVPGVATQFEPVGVTGAGRYQPVPTAGARQFQPVGVGAARMPTAARPTYGAMQLGGAGERAAMLSRMMGVSPEEEAAAIAAMSQPAMRQFREEILPTTRGAQVGAGTAWSTMRGEAEAGAGADLAERLAAMGEQQRMARRGQAMQAGQLGMQEAQAGVQAGLARYGTEMQPYMQAMGMTGQEAMQRQALGAQTGIAAQQLGAQSAAQAMQAQAQAGMQAQQLGSAEAMQAMQARTQAGMAAQQLGAQGGIANLQAQMQAAMQAQQLTAQGTQSREQMLAQLLGIPMMGVYSY